MYVNLSELIHTLTTDLFGQTFLTAVPDNIEEFDEDMLKVLAAFCEMDMILSKFPPSWVEITGKEEYVKHSLLDIS
jgi:hypothetical protein